MFVWSMGMAPGGELPAARVDRDQPTTAREIDAADRLGDRACSAAWGAIPIGLGRICAGRPADGLVLAGLAGVHATTAVLADGNAAGTATGSFVAVMATSVGLDVFDGWLAHRRPYTPPETLGELAAAPFRAKVLSRPGVFLGAGLGAAAALGFVYTFEAASGEDIVLFDEAPNLFGAEPPPWLGYPVGLALTGQAALHVAVWEEVVFRGILQSALSRATDPTAGWLLATIPFTALHIGNWIAASEESEQGIAPFIAGPLFVGGMGLVMGAAYKGYGFHLSHPVAIHFWYDLLLLGAAFLDDADNGLYAVEIALPW
jgi:membrane protease YdiL (CAAX protease family)